jgi:hypothetical protein
MDKVRKPSNSVYFIKLETYRNKVLIKINSFAITSPRIILANFKLQSNQQYACVANFRNRFMFEKGR